MQSASLLLLRDRLRKLFRTFRLLFHINDGLALAGLVQGSVQTSFLLLDITRVVSSVLSLLVLPTHILLVGTLVPVIVVPLLVSLLASSLLVVTLLAISLFLAFLLPVVGLLVLSLVRVYSLKGVSLVVVPLVLVITLVEIFGLVVVVVVVSFLVSSSSSPIVSLSLGIVPIVSIPVGPVLFRLYGSISIFLDLFDSAEQVGTIVVMDIPLFVLFDNVHDHI